MGALVSSTPCYVMLVLASAISIHAEELAVNNKLAACVALEQKRTMALDNLIVLDVQLAVKKPVSECGCFSASVTYRSYVKRGGVNDILQQGQINALHGGAKNSS